MAILATLLQRSESSYASQMLSKTLKPSTEFGTCVTNTFMPFLWEGTNIFSSPRNPWASKQLCGVYPRSNLHYTLSWVLFTSVGFLLLCVLLTRVSSSSSSIVVQPGIDWVLLSFFIGFIRNDFRPMVVIEGWPPLPSDADLVLERMLLARPVHFNLTHGPRIGTLMAMMPTNCHHVSTPYRHRIELTADSLSREWTR